jgi:hypothetical protein
LPNLLKEPNYNDGNRPRYGASLDALHIKRCTLVGSSCIPFGGVWGAGCANYYSQRDGIQGFKTPQICSCATGSKALGKERNSAPAVHIQSFMEAADKTGATGDGLFAGSLHEPRASEVDHQQRH